MTRIAAKVTSWTVTAAAGIVSRGKRARRTMLPWSISDSAAASSDWEKNVHAISPIIRNTGKSAKCCRRKRWPNISV